MSQLVVGGIVIPVAPSSGSRDRLDDVDRARAFDNTYRASVTGSPKREWHFSTPPISRVVADYYESILGTIGSQVCQGELLGLSNNMLAFSEQKDNAVWTKAFTTITADTSVVAAPDGTFTADKIKEDNTTNVHRVYQVNAAFTGSIYTFSTWAQQAERTKCVIAMTDTSSGEASVGVDLTNGSTFASGLVVGSWTGISSVVEPWPNGWYRIKLTATRGAGTAATPEIYLWTTAISYLGVTGNGIYSWGDQLENAAAASTYTKTTSSSILPLTVNCCTEIGPWTPVKVQSGHYVVLNFTLHEV